MTVTLAGRLLAALFTSVVLIAVAGCTADKPIPPTTADVSTVEQLNTVLHDAGYCPSV